ncbi:RbsD/FucU domain-containing protein [Nostocoides sp. Soil756]|uniref:RbsD/FucU family protein n=1 Tax=Nostocoides sp. Soil756 TaxID=1736399 RepID=UPI0006F4DDB5|nr:RbsD/FucU domain-containing protein [Tetrasphaera sp. Soil756]KRE62387.1 hypothetical protein ASG78_04955 [Tetrasphaera sp. Soil756]
MLKGIHPILTGRLLAELDRLGHGDVLGVVDRNFPAHRYGVPVVELRDSDIAAAVEAILTVYPLDSFVPHPVERMEVDDRPDEINGPTAAFLALAAAAEGRDIEFASLERQSFYERAASAMVMVQTGETVGYSCYLLKKGVVG